MCASDLILHKFFSATIFLLIRRRLINALIPNAVGATGMILIGRNSDEPHERRWHFVACVAIAAGGLGITTLLQENLWGQSLPYRLR